MNEENLTATDHLLPIAIVIVSLVVFLHHLLQKKIRTVALLSTDVVTTYSTITPS